MEIKYSQSGGKKKNIVGFEVEPRSIITTNLASKDYDNLVPPQIMESIKPIEWSFS
jgi:hypothetical protein